MPTLLLLWQLLAAPADEKFPPELVRFTPLKKEPIFTAEPGQWDAKIRERGWIMKDGDTWKMWYTGYDGTADGLRMLGYATSPDGLKWTRHPRNPLVKDLWIEDMMVVREKDRYLMFAEGKHDRAHLLESADGIAWKSVGKLDVRLKNGKPIPDGPYGTPTVWRENDIWYLFYERGDDGIWLATSKDLKVFTNVQDEPVLSPGPDEYDRDQVAFNQIIRHRGRYYAYYHGNKKTGPNAKNWSTAIATSTDLVRWEKYAGNPLRPIEENKSSGILIPFEGKFRLYTMHPSVFVHIPER
jgi:sucrose-6-phosphate hydrolase SacC (GH32 family)